MPRVQPELSGFARLRFQRRARLGGEEPDVGVEVWGFGDGLLVLLEFFKKVFFLSFFKLPLGTGVHHRLSLLLLLRSSPGGRIVLRPLLCSRPLLARRPRSLPECLCPTKKSMHVLAWVHVFAAGAVQVVAPALDLRTAFFFCFWVLTSYRVLFTAVKFLLVSSSHHRWPDGGTSPRAEVPRRLRSGLAQREETPEEVLYINKPAPTKYGFFPLLESHLEAVQAKGAVRKGWPRRLTGGRGEEEEGETKRAGFHFGPIPPRVTMLVSQIHRLENGVVFLNIW